MKTQAILVALALSASLSNAATVTVSAGLPAAGIFVTVDNATTNYFFSVGKWDTLTSTWTSFGSASTISGELKGSVISTSPTSLNNEIINVFVGTAATPAACLNGSFMILSSTANTKFPADVTTSASVTFNASAGATATTPTTSILFNGNAQNGFLASAPANSTSALNLVTVPETSTALLGALGALGLLRRRR